MGLSFSAQTGLASTPIVGVSFESALSGDPVGKNGNLGSGYRALTYRLGMLCKIRMVLKSFSNPSLIWS
jgi:hypothetical protein